VVTHPGTNHIFMVAADMELISPICFLVNYVQFSKILQYLKYIS